MFFKLFIFFNSRNLEISIVCLPKTYFFFVAAKDRLDHLDKEKKLLDNQLKVAHDKIQLSEERREVLEARLLEVAPSLRDGDRVRRAHSFVPSTKERPVMLEVRAATLRRPSKN